VKIVYKRVSSCSTRMITSRNTVTIPPAAHFCT